MHKSLKSLLATSILAGSLAVAAPAFAEDEAASDITITGSATLTSDYRLRGISQTDKGIAVQGALTVTHSSGLYVGTWASNLGGNGTWGGSDMELDLIAGFSKGVGAVTLDGGVVYYVYPGTKGHDYIELYGSVAAPIGPVKAKLGTYWAPKQNNIGGDNIWVYTDLALPIEGTPITLKAHGGYSDGNSIYTYGSDVFDYSFGADISYKMLTLNVSYTGTDMNKGFANVFYGAGSKSGRAITKGGVVATLTAAF